jgi:hypothetical protein
LPTAGLIACVLGRLWQQQEEFELLVQQKAQQRAIAAFGGEDDIGPVMEEYTTNLKSIAQRTNIDPVRPLTPS